MDKPPVYGGIPMRTVDITPTWLGLLPGLLGVLEQAAVDRENDETDKRLQETAGNVLVELKKMAGLADAHKVMIEQGRQMAMILAESVITIRSAASTSRSKATRDALVRIEGVISRL